MDIEGNLLMQVALFLSTDLMLRAVMSERIGERHASACRYEDEVPEGSRHSARRTHFWTRDVYSQGWPWELYFADCWQACRDGVILPTM